MKFKDFVLPVGLALLTTWIIQHYVFPPTGSVQQEVAVKSGQGFTAPKVKQEYKPINTEIDFYDNEVATELQRTVIETQGAKLVFTNHGAALETIAFTQVDGAVGGAVLSTVQTPAEADRDGRCFIVGLNEKTPYFYTLAEKQESEDKVELTYAAETSDVSITKKFTVYKKTFKIDLDLTVAPKKGTQEARIFFTSPVVTEIASYDVVSAIVSNEKGAITKVARDSLNAEQGWYAPTLFGSDDRYFVHALIGSEGDFVQRAYTKFAEKQQKGIVSIIEGPSVSEKQTWRVSFYMGPKEVEAMAMVDQRLEQTLDYSGFFAPISKFLLHVLKLIYHYVKNYGFAIIVLTLLVKMILLPFTFRAEESMKKRMEFDKKLKYIQQKYKDNPEMLARERTELIQKHGMPGLGGCLPLFLQVPIFIALSRVLSSAIELYKAPFVLWISDLSVKDPFYVLPILIVIGMILQQLATVTSADPKQRLSSFAMALVVGAVTSSLAAGLALYICTFTFLGVAQTYIVRAFKRS